MELQFHIGSGTEKMNVREVLGNFAPAPSRYRPKYQTELLGPNYSCKLKIANNEARMKEPNNDEN